MNFSIKEIDISSSTLWDEFVEKSPQGTIYHTFKWKKIIDTVKYYNHKILAVCSNNEILAGIVFSEKKKFIFKIATMPLFTTYGGFLLKEKSEPGETESLPLQAAEFLMKHILSKYDEISLVLSPQLENKELFSKNNFEIIPRITYYLDFLNPENLMQTMDSALRRQIKKAEKSNFKISSEIQGKEFCELMEKTFSRKNNKINFPHEIIENAVDEKSLKDNRFLFCAKTNEDKIAAALMILCDNKRCYYSLAGADPESLNTGVMPWLIINALKIIREKNIEYPTENPMIKNPPNKISVMDFVGGNIPSIAKFKERFAPQKIEYIKVQKFNSLILKTIKKISGRI